MLISALDLWSMGKLKGAQSLWMTLKGYAERNWQIYFITGNKEKDSIYDVQQNIHIIRFDAHWLKRWFRYKEIGFVARVMWWVMFQLVSFFLAIRTISKEHLKIDLVYAYETTAVPIARLLKLILRVPMVSRFQGTTLYPWFGRSFWQLRQWESFLAFKIPADLYIMTNDGTRGDAVLRTLGVDMRLVKFWMNGVDKMACERISVDMTQVRHSLNIGVETKVLLILSRLVSWKRVDRALVALPKVVQKHRDVVLVIIGDGPERHKLEGLVDTLQVREYVRFLGALPHDETWTYLKIADLFLSLYDISNVGNPLLEAMSCGKCIVTLNTGDTGTIIRNRENGVLLEPDELSRLASIICDLLEDKDLRTRLGQNARDFALNRFWTWEERIKEETSVVEKLIIAHENA